MAAFWEEIWPIQNNIFLIYFVNTKYKVVVAYIAVQNTHS